MRDTITNIAAMTKLGGGDADVLDDKSFCMFSLGTDVCNAIHRLTVTIIHAGGPAWRRD